MYHQLLGLYSFVHHHMVVVFSDKRQYYNAFHSLALCMLMTSKQGMQQQGPIVLKGKHYMQLHPARTEPSFCTI